MITIEYMNHILMNIFILSILWNNHFSTQVSNFRFKFKNLAPILYRNILSKIRNFEILIPASFIILTVSIVDIEPEKVKPVSPAADTNSCSQHSAIKSNLMKYFLQHYQILLLILNE